MAKDSNSNLIAAIAHISVLFMPVILPVLILLLKKDDKYVSYHAMQATIYQILMFVIAMIVGIFTLGLGLIIVMPLLVLYGLYGTWKAFQGDAKFSYLFVDKIQAMVSKK